MAPPIHIPKAVGTYEPSTIDTDMRSQINSVLIADGSISEIHNKVTHALQTNASDWSDRIARRTRELLRSGECTTMLDCRVAILREIRTDTLSDRGKEEHDGGVIGKARNGHREGEGLAIPPPVVKEGLKVTKGCLEKVAEF